MTRLLVECTYVFEHPKVNSGIQRVVRNVIRELPEADETVECIPVAMLDGTLYQVHSLAPLDPRPHSPLVRLRILVERAANYFWLGQRTLEKRRPFRSSPWARRLLYVACRLFAFAFLSIPLRLLDRILGKQQPAPCARPRSNIGPATNWSCWTPPGTPISSRWRNASRARAWASSR